MARSKAVILGQQPFFYQSQLMTPWTAQEGILVLPPWIYEPRHEKTNVLVCDLVRHKPGCTATEDGYRLEISDLESRGIVLSM